MTQQKTALITGITGQDGSYLAEFLLAKGYTVHGIKRRASSFNTQRVDHLYQDPHITGAKFKLHYGDLSDSSNLTRIIQETQPDEIYNLGAQSHVAVSFESPEYTADVDGMGTLRILEAIRILGLEKKTRFYQASTSELYGLVQETQQCETTPFYPRSPYAVAKLYAGSRHCGPRPAIHAVRSYGCRIRSGMTLSKCHESMLQQDHPEDFVIATGVQYSVRQFINWTAEALGMQLRWEGEGVNEVGYWQNPPPAVIPGEKAVIAGSDPQSMPREVPIIRIDPRYFRPTEVETLLGDPSVQLRTELKICPASFRLNKNSAGCLRSPRKNCAKRWSPMTWRRLNSTRCSNSMGMR